METFFCPCPRGLASALVNELNTCGAVHIVPADAGVTFKGDWAAAYRANLHSRIATRVLWRVAHFSYQNEHDIYDAAFLLAWTSWFDVSRTIKVEVNAQRSPVKSLDFVTLRIKDAIADKFREVMDKRPSVAVREPDVRIHAFLSPTECTLYIDLSGEPLFKRGRRDHTGEAPLKKNLAAGIIALSGWQPDETFFDPMCGSGTFLVEAAEMALNIAPGLSGGQVRAFALEKLKNFDGGIWQEIVDQARNNEKKRTISHIFGSDMYGEQLKFARENLVANGLGDCVHLKQANILEVSAPTDSGVLVTNPPYGDRLGDAEELADLYPKLGDLLKQKFAGWRAYFFSGDTNLPKGIRLSTNKKIPLFNGKIECRLYEYKIIAGSNRRPEVGGADTPATNAS